MRPRRPWSALAVLTFAALVAACRGEPTGDPLILTVPSGAALGEVADTLESREIIEYGVLFRGYVRLKGADTRIRAGRYAFRKGESWEKIVSDLTAGRVLTDRLTIPEGFRVDQMVPRIAALSGVPEDSVRKVLEGDSAHVRWGVPGPGLEGYLFPDTYHFAPGTPVERIVDVMTDRYRSYWTPERRARLDSLDLTEGELVTLASIVQAEARLREEMPRIAGVYWNRLERDHPLQADPTVLYALGGPRERLLYAAIDSVADSPYNTYRNAGLPPGPIGAPGARALDAALRPESSEFFYFVARPTGEHVFTRTIAAHNRAKARARREWDAARASVGTPGPEDGAVADTVGADTVGADTAGLGASGTGRR